MEQNFDNRIEQEKGEVKFGRNVDINAIFLRHGEKAFASDKAETSLTEEGRQMSSDFGSSLEEKGAIKAYSSQTERTIDTAILAVNAAPTGQKLALRIRDELRVPYDEKGKFMTSLFAMKKEMLGSDFASQPVEEQKQRLQKYYSRQHDLYLNYGEMRPDSSMLSPVEIAARIAERVDVYAGMAKRLKSGSKVDLVNATHDWAIASFLKEVIIREKEGQEVRGFEAIEDVGGPIQYTEHFSVHISTDSQGRVENELEFRGRKYKIDFNRLKELVEIAKHLK